MIRIAELLDPNVPTDLWPLLKQVGVDDVVSLLDDAEQAFRWLRSESHLDERPESVALSEEGRSWSRPALERLKARYEEAGFDLVAIEDTPPMDDIRLGRPGREEQLDLFCEQLRAMGAVGVPVLCYNWVAVYSWARTGLAVPARGGALVTEYDHAAMLAAPPRPEADAATEERLWENLEYFLRRVVPVAEEANVRLALHPDDPPISPVRGLGRIMRTVEAFERVVEVVPQPPQRDDHVPGELRAHDRRPARRDPGVRTPREDPLRPLPGRPRDARALRRDLPRPGADRHARLHEGIRRRRL